MIGSKATANYCFLYWYKFSVILIITHLISGLYYAKHTGQANRLSCPGVNVALFQHLAIISKLLVI